MPAKVSTDKPALVVAIKVIITAEQLVLGDLLVNRVGMVLVLIPAGEFRMGSPASEAGRCDDETQHRVQITKSFYLSAHEVTQEQYKHVMGTDPSYFSALVGGNRYVAEIDTSQFPVEQVSWNDSVKKCRLLSAEEGVGIACRSRTSGNAPAVREQRRLTVLGLVLPSWT